MSVLFKGGTVVNATGRYLADVFADGDKTVLQSPNWRTLTAAQRFLQVPARCAENSGAPVKPPG